MVVIVCLVGAFTKTPGEGSGAGVVLDASGLTDRQMQTIGRIVNGWYTATRRRAPPGAASEGLKMS
ncbi:MAG: PhzF family phenazine biosynthesis protein [Terriglobales bacterium]